MDIDKIVSLKKIDWEFSDYNSQLYPADINFIHWYPGVFVPQIPSVLINALSKEGESVLDPFAGSGITLLEAARIKRKFIGVDLNPFAINIIKAKIFALTQVEGNWFAEERNYVNQLTVKDEYLTSANAEPELVKWFHKDTLNQLLALHNHIETHKSSDDNILREVVFSAILNRCSSQRDHYTYITDKCFPKQFVNKNAIQAYIDHLDLVERSVSEAKKQYFRTYNHNWDFTGSTVYHGDSRNLSWIPSNSVDLVVTSPPYLGVNDYARSMHLSSLFFKKADFETAIVKEIGARRKRQRKNAYDEYISDMEQNLLEIIRVLKPGRHLALIIGKGSGKVNSSDPIQRLLDFICERGLEKVFEEQRRIKFRRIQVAGVGSESIYVFQKASQ